jgi:threonine dehydrogenase-like Zn-dependent dehydrogenase
MSDPSHRSGGPAPGGIQRVVASGGKVTVVTEPEPVLRKGEILVETECSVISPGTERTIIEATTHEDWLSHEYPTADQTWPLTRSPAVRQEVRLPRPPGPLYASLGYSLAGRVMAVADDVADLTAGDLVACSGSQCAFHAQRVAVPRNLTARVPDNVPADKAAFVTLGAIAVEALRRSGRAFGETVVVFGCGVLGALITMLARASGMSVIGVDPQPDRREVVRDAGAVLVLDPAGGALADQVRARTDGFGADAALIAVTTDRAEVLTAAVESLRPGGVVVGIGQFAMGIDRDAWFQANATLVPAVAYGPGRYDPVYEENNWDFPIGLVRWTENRNMAMFLRFIAEARIDLDRIPTRRVPYWDAETVYTALARCSLPLTGLLLFDQPGKAA